MLSFEPEVARNKVPATVVCSVDGAAKSETIERILATGGQRWAVISNETDGPELDATVVERVAGQMVPHAIGCL